MVLIVTESTGELCDKLTVDFFTSTGKSKSRNIPIFLSPNGRYLAYPVNPAYINSDW